MANKIRYQLLRPKTRDYKDPKALPEMASIIDDKGNKKMVQDMEIFCTDYPFKMPLIVYNQQESRQMDAHSPFIVHKGELWGIYTFVQVKKDLINLFCIYGGEAKHSPMTKVK